MAENTDSNTSQSVFPEWKYFLGTSKDPETASFIRNIVKRSGEITGYDRTKIEKAINKAIEAVDGEGDMEKAKKLLKNTTKSAGEIAQEVGYKDSHYFSFVFKKTQGCSPREYRSGKKGQADRQADGQ